MGHNMQSDLNFNCKKIVPMEEKSTAPSPTLEKDTDAVLKKGLGDNLSSLTPVKTVEPLRSKIKGVRVEDSVKYQIIAEFFDCMESSLRLLNLRKRIPTFQNICTQVEIMTKRKFSYNHLAQIKYILPEAILIEKILTHDVETLCMKPEMKITLLLDAIDAQPCQSPFMALRQLFRTRLLDLLNTYPEGCDIPEAVLPEPFNKRNQTSIEPELLSNSSHLSSSFSRHFSQKIIFPDTGKTQVLMSSNSLSPVDSASKTNQDTQFPQQEEPSSVIIKSPSTKSLPEPTVGFQCCKSSSAYESPSMKLASLGDTLMVETPAQQTPKRLIPSYDEKMSSHTAAKRSLNFLNMNEDRCNGTDPICIINESKEESVLNTGLQTASKIYEDNARSSPALQLVVKEDKGDIQKDRGVSYTCVLTRQQMLASLPNLFDVIQHIFQSVNFTSITKQELVYKIILNDCDIVVRSEVEEQLEILEELAPDWIYKKLVPSGDILYSIKKVSDQKSIRAMLVKAV